MLEAATAIRAGDRDSTNMETLIAFRRAGRTGIRTWHALEIARELD
jgi:porphobilinogen synthase